MINVDLQQLVQALDAASRRDLEAAAERCVGRGGSKILVEDLLLCLLERSTSLLVRALQDAEVDPGELSKALQPHGEHKIGRASRRERAEMAGMVTGVQIQYPPTGT